MTILCWAPPQGGSSRPTRPVDGQSCHRRVGGATNNHHHPLPLPAPLRRRVLPPPGAVRGGPVWRPEPDRRRHLRWSFVGKGSNMFTHTADSMRLWFYHKVVLSSGSPTSSRSYAAMLIRWSMVGKGSNTSTHTTGSMRLWFYRKVVLSFGSPTSPRSYAAMLILSRHFGAPAFTTVESPGWHPPVTASRTRSTMTATSTPPHTPARSRHGIAEAAAASL